MTTVPETAPGVEVSSDGAEVLPGTDGARVRKRDGAEVLRGRGGADVASRGEKHCRPNRTVFRNRNRKNSARNRRRGSDGAEVLPAGKGGARVRGRDGAEDLPVEGGAPVAHRVETIWRIFITVFAVIINAEAS